MFDLVVKNGTIVDGTGAAPFVGDIAITDGVLVQVGGDVDGEATETIDATGLVVTPGFVDVHSHYDGQATFDSALSPTSGHGVTTVVVGSCGVGFAPARPTDHELLITTMESVEDIPGDVLRAGLPWDWETFPDFLDALERRQFSMDLAAQIGHVAVRTWVMGDRGVANEPATSADIDAMGAIVREGIQAGALGFSTSRVLGHRTAAGDPVPGTFASEDELFGIAAAMQGAGRAVYQIAESGADGQDPEAALKELDWMRRLSAEFKIPVSFLLLQSAAAPDLFREILDKCLEAKEDGAELVAQVANRPFGMLLGLTSRNPFVKRATYARLLADSGSFDDLVAELRKPDVRAAILAEDDTVATGDKFEGIGLLVAYRPEMVFLLDERPDYEPGPEESIKARAEAAGVGPLDLFYDLMLGHDGKALFVVPFFNFAHGNHDDIHEMLVHPASVPGLADGGAHLATICDASMPTYQISHWVKRRTKGPKLALEDAVKMHTHDTAALFGLGDRGVLAVGKKGDLNVIDLDALDITMPYAVSDLPAGGTRLTQDAVGYVATVVSGVVTRRHDADTGARPGRLVRGAR
ncbi:MAG: Amidohydrolase [Ilumatobacteraceae bacterium]|nr:Amidohydrolase [Ilumatobacteraceae bacterium]